MLEPELVWAWAPEPVRELMSVLALVLALEEQAALDVAVCLAEAEWFEELPSEPEPVEAFAEEAPLAQEQSEAPAGAW